MAAPPEDAEIFHRLGKADFGDARRPQAAEDRLHVLLHVADRFAD